MSQRSITRLALIGLLSLICSGCTSTRTILIETQADPNYAFAAPSDLRIAIGAVAPSDDPESTATAGDSRFAVDELTLEQRIIRADLEAGMNMHGFTIVEDPQDAAVVMYFTETYQERAYDTYERVPVTSSSFGFGWGHGHSRDFYSTSFSSALVPVTRVERIGTIWLAASPAERALASGSADRSPAQIAIWMGSLRTEAADLQANRLAHISQLLARWGQTGREAIEVPRTP